MLNFNRLSTFVLAFCLASCEQSSDIKQQIQQEQILSEGVAQLGMPAIKNFREKKMMKTILELRDQSGFTTYTYTFSEQTGKYRFFCNSVGYGLPYATQYTNPQKISGVYNGSEHLVIAQADPNGLFTPTSAEGTWVMCKNPKGDDVKPVYIEPRVIVSPFELPSDVVEATHVLVTAGPNDTAKK